MTDIHIHVRRPHRRTHDDDAALKRRLEELRGLIKEQMGVAGRMGGRAGERLQELYAERDDIKEKLGMLTERAISRRTGWDAQTPSSFWSYQASSPTPSLEEAIKMGAIAANSTQAEWDRLSPGMKREIVRSTKRKNGTDAKPISSMSHPEIVAELKAGATGPRREELLAAREKRNNEMVPTGTGRSVRASQVAPLTRRLLGWDRSHVKDAYTRQMLESMPEPIVRNIAKYYDHPRRGAGFSQDVPVPDLISAILTAQEKMGFRQGPQYVPKNRDGTKDFIDREDVANALTDLRRIARLPMDAVIRIAHSIGISASQNWTPEEMAVAIVRKEYGEQVYVEARRRLLAS